MSDTIKYQSALGIKFNSWWDLMIFDCFNAVPIIGRLISKEILICWKLMNILLVVAVLSMNLLNFS